MLTGLSSFHTFGTLSSCYTFAVAINPYSPGAGTDPPVLAGRDAQLALVDSAAARAEGGLDVTPLILTGLRGMGKTVLLHEARSRLDKRGWGTTYLEGRKSLDAEDATRLLIAEVERHLGAGRRLLRSSRKILSSVGGVNVGVGPAGGTIGVQRTAGTQDSSDTSLISALRLLGRAAREEGRGFALFLDELQTLRRRDLSILIRSLSSLRGLPVVFVGAGLPYLPAELAAASTYAERFNYAVVDWLPAGDVREALVPPARDSGHAWTGDGYESVYRLSHGYPYFVQLYASESWDHAERTGSEEIGKKAVRAAEPRVRSRVDVGLYAARYDRATPSEQRYLQAMARLWQESSGQSASARRRRPLEEAAGSVERVRSGDVARALDQPLTAVGPIRDRLIRKGLIHAPQHGVIAFSVPGFADYVLRRVDTEEL
ncbi:MAG: ATP-binding protein [Acidimicrobiales bacterium]